MRRNVLLLAASVLAISAGAAFADSSTVYLNQYDASQSANIDQSGSNNSVGGSGNPFQQNNGGGTGSNNLTVLQQGSGNSIGRDKNGFQSGTTNSAKISQSGNNSDVELQQNGANNGTFTAGLGWTNSPNTSVIVQDGSSNGSKVDLGQAGNNNSSISDRAERTIAPRSFRRDLEATRLTSDKARRLSTAREATALRVEATTPLI